MAEIDTQKIQEEIEAAIKPKRSIRWRIAATVLILIVACGAIAAGYYGRLYFEKMKTNTNSAKFYSWEGDYVETTKYLATMTIKAQARKGFYDVTISMGDENDSDIIFWTFTAVYNEETNTLIYTDGKRKDMITSTATESESASLVTEEVYNNGTGFLEVRGGDIFWTDNEEYYGKGLVFERA